MYKKYPTYYDTWTPFVIGLISAGLNIAGALYAAPLYGIIGLVAAYSFSMIFQMALLWIFLHHRLGSLYEKNIIITLLKISIAAFFMALMTQLLKYPLSAMVDMQKFWGILIQGAVSGMIGLLVYGAICSELKLPEMKHFQESLKRRWLKLRHIQGEVNEADNV